MVEVKQSQVPHLVEGTRRDLRNTVLTEAELF